MSTQSKQSRITDKKGETAVEIHEWEKRLKLEREQKVRASKIIL
jgi:hypothetical protein